MFRCQSHWGMKRGRVGELGDPRDPDVCSPAKALPGRPSVAAQQEALPPPGDTRGHQVSQGLLTDRCKPHRARPRPPVITPFLLQERVHRHRTSGRLTAATASLSKLLLHNRFHTPPIESSNRGLLLIRSPSTHSLSQGPSKHQDISSAIIKGKRGTEAVPRPPAPSSRTERLGHRSQTHRKQAAACGSQKPQ